MALKTMSSLKNTSFDFHKISCKVLVTFSHEHLKNDVLKNKQKIKDKVKNLTIFLNADMAANEKNGMQIFTNTVFFSKVKI